MLTLWSVTLLFLKLMCYGDSQLCPGDNFLSLTEIQDLNREDLVSLSSAEVPFTEWIFPNSLRFQCDGMITGWVFAAKSVNLSTIQRLPQWSIYRDVPLTLSELDFSVEYRTGDRDELAEIQPGLYRYILKSPVNVSEGDVLGIGYSNEPTGSRQLQLSFLNVSTETSYRREFTASSLLVARSRNGVNRFLPVVTPLVAPMPTTTNAMAISSTTGSFTTNSVPTLPPQTESPTTVNPATFTPTAVSTIATESSTSLEPQTTTEFSESPTTSEPLTTQQPSTTTDQPAPLTEPVATEEEQTSAPTDPSVALPPTASSVKLGVIIGVVAGLLGAVLVMMVMGIVVLIIMRRRKQFKSKNLTYQGQFEINAKEQDLDECKPHTTTSILMETNQCYCTTTSSLATDQLYATVEGEHQPQDMELTQNQAYITTSIPVEINQCYGTTTPSVATDQLYATVKGEH